jgi:hypothetical protein
MKMKRMTFALLVSLVLFLCVFQPVGSQELSYEGKNVRLIKALGEALVVFTEDGNDAGTGDPLPPPSVPLAPITDEQQINFETGVVTIPGKTIKNYFLVDVYLRQRFGYRNDGQDFFRVITLPVIELESEVFNGLNDPVTGEPLNGKWRITLNRLFIGANKTLVAGERGADNRGNRESFLFSAELLDENFGAGTASSLFKSDMTIRMSVENTVRGVSNFVTGTTTKVYGD